MLGKFVPNINDAMSSSLGKHIPKPVKQQVKGGSNVLSKYNLPGPFSVFNAPKPAPKPKPKPKLKENIILPKGGPFNPFPNIIAALSEKIDEKPKPKPKAKTQRAATSTTTGVDLMKGKWVKTGSGRRWQPDGLNRPMTPLEQRQWALRLNRDSDKVKKEPEPQYIKNTWEPPGSMIGFYG